MAEISELKRKAKVIFLKNREIICPAFPKEKIFFNSRGINHLFYKNPRNIRKLREIETRIELVPRAIKLLELMPIFQEESSCQRKGGHFLFLVI